MSEKQERDQSAKILVLTLVVRLSESGATEVVMSTNVKPITEVFWRLFQQIFDDLRLSWLREQIRFEESQRASSNQTRDSSGRSAGSG